MILTGKKLGFRDIRVISDDEAAVRIAREGAYDRLTVVTHSEIPEFENKHFRIIRKRGGIINVAPSPTDILASFSETTQKKIKRSYRYEGFASRIEKYPFSEDAWGLYRSFEKGRGAIPFPRDAFSECLCFIVSDGGAVVSGAFVYPILPVVTARSFFSRRREAGTHEAYKRVSYATNRCYYECCVWAHDQGATGFDIGPINDSDPAKAGISEFKRSFNPSLVPEYTYIFSQPLYRVLERLRSWVNHLRRGVQIRARFAK